MKNILKFLGSVGKGGLTALGGALGIGGIAVGGGDLLSQCITELTKQPDSAIAAVGIVLALLGLGRKTGYIAGSEKKEPTP